MAETNDELVDRVAALEIRVAELEGKHDCMRSSMENILEAVHTRIEELEKQIEPDRLLDKIGRRLRMFGVGR